MTRKELSQKLIEAGMDQFLAGYLVRDDYDGGAHISFSDLDGLDGRKVRALVKGSECRLSDKGIWFHIN